MKSLDNVAYIQRSINNEICFFLTTHIGALQSFASAIRGMQIRIQVPGQSLQKHLHYGNFDVEPTALSAIGIELNVIEEEEYFESPPDLLICTHPFTQEVMYNHAVRMREIKPVILCCYTQGFSVPHDFRYFDALIAVDYPSYVRGQTYGIPSVFYWPWVDFEFWTPPSIEPDEILIRMFCNSLEQRPHPLPQIFHSLSDKLPPGQLQNYEWLPSSQVRELLHGASATLSIKPNEGYGYSVIESLACGRPIFVYKPLIGYQTYSNWLIDGKTCVFFNSEDELEEKFKYYAENPSWRRALRDSSASLIRDIINNDQQSLQMRQFIEGLIENKKNFTSYVPDTEIFRIEFASKREIWNILSNKMWWDPIAGLKDKLSYIPEYGLVFDLNKYSSELNAVGNLVHTSEEFRLVCGVYQVGILRQSGNVDDLDIRLELFKGISRDNVSSLRSKISKITTSWIGFVIEIDSDDEPLKFEAQVSGTNVVPLAFIRPYPKAV